MAKINSREVGPIGLGLMGFTWRNSPVPQEQAFHALRVSLELGCNCWNGGEIYGPATGNSLVLLERYFAQYPEHADKVVISIKGGVELGTLVPNGSPDGIRRSLDACIGQLKGRKRIDMFECARRDPKVPLAVTFGIIQDEYIATGRVDGISLSEVSAATIHEAVKITKIVAVEVELSLWATDVLHNGIAAACAQYSIPMIAYAPIGRGMLSGRFASVDELPEGDPRRHLPRFQQDNFAANLKIVGVVDMLAAKKGCTPAQLAINWVRCLSKRPGMPAIIPIPGATTADRIRENSVLVDLSDAEMDEIEAVVSTVEISGGRYAPGAPMNT